MSMSALLSIISISVAALCLTIFTGSAFAKDVIADANAFTVKIVAAITFPFEQESKGTAAGAGFLVDRGRGWILTNAHVAGRSPSFVPISFNGYPLLKAEKVYVDNHLDVAVLKIEPASIPKQAAAAELQCAAEYPPAALLSPLGIRGFWTIQQPGESSAASKLAKVPSPCKPMRRSILAIREGRLSMRKLA